MCLPFRHICWQCDDQFSKKGGKDNIRTTILHADKTLETNEVCFLWQSNIVTWFQSNGQNVQQRTIEAFFNEGKRTTGHHLKTFLTIDN